MVFVDHAHIIVKAGDGGRGSSAFAQPPYTRTPFPDGGDGGDGGDVVVQADSNVATLLDFQFRHEFKAARGGHGGSNRKTGKRGGPCVIRVPVGTVIRDTASREVLGDLLRPGETVLVAKGGRGSQGNASRTAAQRAALARGRRGGQRGMTQAPGRGVSRGARTHRTRSQNPVIADALPGRPGQQRQVSLELKLIADVGIVGLPNAGKSSLLSRMSTARPKIAAYPFTTKYPVLGVANVDAQRAFVACDIPGLIEGAHEGKGLGIRFLRHIERTRVLIHVIDMAALDGRDPLVMYEMLNQELEAYSPTLRSRPQLIAANKMDVPQSKEHLARFRAKISEPVYEISCATNVGVARLVEAAWHRLQSLPHEALSHAATDGPHA